MRTVTFWNSWFIAQFQKGQAAAMSESRPGASKVLKRVAVPRFSSQNRIQRLLPNKLVRINGHIYSVRQKAGKRTLVRQATVDKSVTPVGVGLSSFFHIWWSPLHGGVRVALMGTI
jgi:hypothetical protein